MDVDFEKALHFDLLHEGIAYENVPGDPGGPTKAGITWEDFFAFLREHGQPVPADHTAVGDMTDEQMRAIYQEHYWTPLKDSQMPLPVDWVLFDAAVNCGVGRAVKWLQAELGVTVDGQVGPDTLAATLLYCQKHGPNTLAVNLITRRRDYYDQIGAVGRPLHKFHSGWINRCGDLLAAIKAGK